MNKAFRISFYALNIIIYLACIIYGIISFFVETPISGTQAILVLIESFAALLGVFAPLLLEKIFNMRISYAITIIVSIFIFLCVVLGEVFQFYYRFNFWDALIHVFGGMFLALLGFMIGNLFFRKRKQKSSVMVIATFAFAFGLMCGMLWEAIEFSLDSLFGTNMQKFIPENEELWNGGNSFEDLNGTDEDLANFFRTPEGYKFALMDTMTDTMCDFVGGILMCSYCIFMYRRDDTHFYRMFNFKKRKKATIVAEPKTVINTNENLQATENVNSLTVEKIQIESTKTQVTNEDLDNKQNQAELTEETNSLKENSANIETRKNIKQEQPKQSKQKDMVKFQKQNGKKKNHAKSKK